MLQLEVNKTWLSVNLIIKKEYEVHYLRQRYHVKELEPIMEGICNNVLRKLAAEEI